jgi:predicted RNase H-like nuclease
MRHSKKTHEGYEERRELLNGALGVTLPSRSLWRSVGVPVGAGPDDVLDAAVAALTGRRAVAGSTERLPRQPDVDRVGLSMEIIY